MSRDGPTVTGRELLGADGWTPGNGGAGCQCKVLLWRHFSCFFCRTKISKQGR